MTGPRDGPNTNTVVTGPRDGPNTNTVMAGAGRPSTTCPVQEEHSWRRPEPVLGWAFGPSQRPPVQVCVSTVPHPTQLIV
jgi:hypothetical protein